MQKPSISLTAATLICFNTMIGAGLFINTPQLALITGGWGFLGYVISACMMLPLIISIAELTRIQPFSGGLYAYSKSYLSPFMGFLSAWWYFVSKATSVALLIHTVVSFFQTRISVLQPLSPLILDYIVLSFFTILSMGGIRIGGKIQYVFTFLKATPIIFAFISGFMCFDYATFTQLGSCDLSAIISIVPVCLYALIGFEVICAVGSFVENPEVNIRKSILRAFGLVAILTVVFQNIFFGVFGPALSSMSEPMLTLLFKAFPTYPLLGKVINGTIFASVIGGAFSVIASNCWNLHTIALHRHLPASSLISSLNRFQAPWVALIIQAFLSAGILAISTKQLPLQNMTIFGIFLSFFITACAAFQAGKKGILRVTIVIPVLGILSCTYVLGICSSNMLKLGISVPFLSLIVLGVVLAALKGMLSSLKGQRLLHYLWNRNV